MKKFNFKEKKEITRYNPDFLHGLTSEEVEERKTNGLVNKKEIKVSVSFFKLILKNIFTFFNITLIIIGSILIFFGQYTSCVFLIILILNTGIGLFQDIRAKIASTKLSLVEASKVKVIRDNKEIEINSDSIVLDDIIKLSKDEKVPCDSIVIEGEASFNESLLTGESLPLKRKLDDEIYAGSYVFNGTCYARVDKIGDDNYINKLQLKSKEFKQTRSRMFVQLNKLFKTIGILVVVLGILEIIEFGISGILDKNVNFQGVYDWIAGDVIRQLSGSLVSMIPSGMYLLTSTALAVGVFNLANEKVLVKDMYSQETLARVDTLCIDKTGTITDGNMSVFDYELIDKNLKKDRFEAYVSSFTKVLGEDNITSKILSQHFVKKEIFDYSEVIHFNSDNKYSAISFKDGGTLVIGAYNYFEITNDEEVKEKVEESSSNGFRVLLVGFSKDSIKKEKLPKKIDAIAIIRLQDHIRDDIKTCISWFNENDVNIKVISGDNPLTVSKIAEASGILNATNYISLDSLSDDEVKEAALKYNVFGRVSPYQKELIVKTLKENEHTVAMVGDGINDILSLKSADVSIALQSGSKATKDIASLVLIDNNFNKLPKVIYEGRRVINNLSRTCMLFLTKTAFSIFMNIFFLIYGMITTFGTKNAILWPFAPNNFYCWELFTIGISSFLLTLENNTSRIKGDFLKNAFKQAIPFGVTIAIPVAAIYLLFLMNGFGFDRTQILNICTLYISIASFFPLLYSCLPFNTFRTGVFIGGILLSTLLYAWSIVGTNWMLINGVNSQAPRFLSTKEIVATLIMLAFYAIVVMSPKVFMIIKRKIKHENGR